MKKLVIYSMLLAGVFMACEPVENRDPMGGSITADQLNISAKPIVVNGKNSNRVILENNSPVLSLWDYGLGTTNKAYAEVLLVLTGENVIKFTGLNADGTKITKDLTIMVDELSFEVPAQWALLCGDGEKTWTWDTTQPDQMVWGNGGYKGNVAPGWWRVSLADVEGQAAGEAAGAEMIFSTKGSSLTKVKSDGSKIKGTFSFDMNKKTLDDGGKVWADGKLYTKNITILCGKSPDEAGIPVYEYDILNLTDEKMALSYAPANTGSWGTAYFWMFMAK